MGANGGSAGSPFVKESDEELNSVVGINDNINISCVEKRKKKKNNDKGISIANRRAGFDASTLLPQLQTCTDIFMVPDGISPSALLASPIGSPVMLPNAQAQPASPTTGRCSFSPNHDGDVAMIIFRCGNSNNKPNSEYLQDRTIAKSEECRNSWEQPVNCKTSNYNRNNKLMLHPNQEQKQQQQKCWEDGFLWRKYGQKQVKGSEFPRSYYKCTSSNCEVTKKVERSLDGQISEIVYKGSHNHPPVRKNEMPDMNIITTDQDDPDLSMDAPPPPPILDDEHCHNDHESISNEGTAEEEEDDDDLHPSDPKRRKIRESLTAGPSYESTTSSARSGREPKVVIQVESEIDILEDGYRWRKYGQKVVKGNPNPRSYYKCTSPDCFVRKHVERAADDIKSVIITYEGKHNHRVPSSRSSNSSAVDNITNPTLSTPSTMSTPMPIPHRSVVNRVQDQRPLYLQERNPILNYNEFMTTTYGSPSYPYSFPTNFHSLPSYSRTPFIVNNNTPMNNYPVVNPIPDSMSISLPSHANHILNVPLDHPNFHYTNYALPIQSPMQPPSDQGQEIKEEPKDIHENNVVYDDHTCLSLPDYGN